MTLSYRALTFSETYKLQAPPADATTKPIPNEPLPVFLISLVFYLPTFLISNITSNFKPLYRSVCYPFMDWVPRPFCPPVYFPRNLDRPFHFYNLQELPSSRSLRDSFCFLREGTERTVCDRLHQRQDQEIYNAVIKPAALVSGSGQQERSVDAIQYWLWTAN